MQKDGVKLSTFAVGESASRMMPSRSARFTIESATASFDPSRPPSNPTVTATATYLAPDATRVFADFAGTAEKGKLRLRSEPPLTQTEILSLVIYSLKMFPTRG